MKRCLKNFHLEITCDENSICTSLFCRYLPTHSHETLTNQNKLVQPVMSKPLLPYAIPEEKSVFQIYPHQNLTIKERRLSESEINHKFGTAYKIEESLFASH